LANRKKIINQSTISKKLYREYARKTVRSPVIRRWLKFGGFLLALYPIIALIYTVYWQITLGEFYLYPSTTETLWRVIFAGLALVGGIVLLALGFNSSKLLVLKGRTRHKHDFFKGSQDNKHVECSVTSTYKSIIYKRDDRSEQIHWSEIAGTLETKHLLLLVFKVTYAFKLKNPFYFKSNVVPIYISEAVILKKDSFTQGSLEDLHALLKKKGIEKYNRKTDTKFNVFT